jgi:DNA-binding GntR family transcriptional regulator
MIEGYAGALACERQPKALADKLQRDCENLERMIAQSVSETAAVRPLIESNATFHERILQASGSTTAIRTLEMLRMPIAYRAFFWQVNEHQLQSLKWHQKIAEAFGRQKPAEVRKLMEAHLVEARDYLISIYDHTVRAGRASGR